MKFRLGLDSPVLDGLFFRSLVHSGNWTNWLQLFHRGGEIASYLRR